MIGNEMLAQAIAATAWHEREDQDGFIRLDSQNDVPEGWEYLSSGGYRHAFKGPDGNVYKVLTAWSMRHQQDANQRNYDKYLSLLDFAEGTGVSLASCDYFAESNVMVQEWIDGMYPDEDDDEPYTKINRFCQKAKEFFLDLHEGNYFIVDGSPVLIDW